jgi:hypothetical protein
MKPATPKTELQPSTQHPIAALYQRSVLDPMVEVARAISHDFVKRPRHYRAVPENVAATLEGFRIRTGSNPEWPNATQRAGFFAALFGDAFHSTSTDLMCAAVAFTERSVAMTPDPLADRVRDAAVAFREYLKGIEGRAVSLADSETGSVFQHAIEVFRNKEVAGLFGVPPASGGNWPFDWAVEADAASSDGAFLIEEIQQALGPFAFRPILTQHLFILSQRVAHYGAMTIAGVLGAAAGWNKTEWIGALVRDAYNWEKALQPFLSYIESQAKNLQPRIVSQRPIDDEELKSLPTEETVQMLLGQQGPWGNKNTCTYGWTRVCDHPGPGQSCLTGSTYYCETGPTCTNGWTIRCDKPAVFFPGGITHGDLTQGVLTRHGD